MTELPAVYEGKEPYIFISYAHKNTARVLPIIAALQSKGFRVWYDAGIEAGTEWPEYIAGHLTGCGCFAAMLTKEALESNNCRREINFAISKEMPMLVVYLEDLELPLGMQMQLGLSQATYYFRHAGLDSFLDTLSRAEILKNCREDTVPAPDAELLYLKGLRARDENREKEAFALFSQAAEGGYTQAQIVLGQHYERSHLTESPQKALAWYKKAAESGNSEGIYQVGHCLEYGIGTPTDREGAVAWYRRAAELGHKEAQFQMGWIYRYGGYGVEPSKGEAIRWYQLANNQGHTGARWELQELL